MYGVCARACVCVCMHVWGVCTCVYVYVCVYGMCAHVCVYGVCTCVCTHVCMHVWGVCTCVCACVLLAGRLASLTVQLIYGVVFCQLCVKLTLAAKFVAFWSDRLHCMVVNNCFRYMSICSWCCDDIWVFLAITFDALNLLVRCQEKRLACENLCQSPQIMPLKQSWPRKHISVKEMVQICVVTMSSWRCWFWRLTCK